MLAGVADRFGTSGAYALGAVAVAIAAVVGTLLRARSEVTRALDHDATGG